MRCLVTVTAAFVRLRSGGTLTISSVMPPEPSLALDASLAPAQIYIVLAITVASFSWLLKPETLGQLAGWQVFIGFLLIFIQFLHLVSYAAIHANWPEFNTVVIEFAHHAPMSVAFSG